MELELRPEEKGDVMFTGIVEEIGSVREIIRGNSSIVIGINCTTVMEKVKTGDSIAVNGICLTVAKLGENCFFADVMPETMRKTSLGKLNRGDGVNLERALGVFDRLGGHIVSGHIDGTGIISYIAEEDNAVWLTIKADYSIMKYIVVKGSVALDGTSLTVAHCDDGSFKVSLIPVTAKATILGLKRVNSLINIECDIIGKYVEKFLSRNINNESTCMGINLDFLKENGFA